MASSMQGLGADCLGEKDILLDKRGRINQRYLFKTCGKVIGKISNCIISQGNQSIA
jgi:hypothetical protein